MFRPRLVRKPALSKPIRARWLPTSILLGWVLGQKISKPVRHKNVSLKTWQETNLIKTYKGHKGPNIYLIGQGASLDFFNRAQARKKSASAFQKCNRTKSYMDYKVANTCLSGEAAWRKKK